MALKLHKPTNNGRRMLATIDYVELDGDRPRKSLVHGKKENAGRNAQGRITVRHRGAGNKRRLRDVDFIQDKFDIAGRVDSIQYDPFRSSFIALIVYRDGDYRYIPLPEGLKKGQAVMSSKKKIDLVLGNRMPLKHIPTGVVISQIEIDPGKGARIARSAGNLATVVAKEGPWVQVRMPSGEIRLVNKEASATIGQVSNLDHANVRLGKAGRARWLRRRPTVLGKNMNPVDHPHGGGEGHNSIGLVHPKTPWGKPALGVKTRRPKKWSNRLIVRPRKGKLARS
jgi:large subunit ribosomal protein L2